MAMLVNLNRSCFALRTNPSNSHRLFVSANECAMKMSRTQCAGFNFEEQLVVCTRTGWLGRSSSYKSVCRTATESAMSMSWDTYRHRPCRWCSAHMRAWIHSKWCCQGNHDHLPTIKISLWSCHCLICRAHNLPCLWCSHASRTSAIFPAPALQNPEPIYQFCRHTHSQHCDLAISSNLWSNRLHISDGDMACWWILRTHDHPYLRHLIRSVKTALLSTD